jgi:hypothetical protein
VAAEELGAARAKLLAREVSSLPPGNWVSEAVAATSYATRVAQAPEASAEADDLGMAGEPGEVWFEVGVVVDPGAGCVERPECHRRVVRIGGVGEEGPLTSRSTTRGR